MLKNKFCSEKVKNITSLINPINVFKIEKLTEGVEELDSILHSKIGGIPYWPKDKKFIYMNNKPAKLMAQINFKEFNKKGILEDFPKDGILQFFYPIDDDMWGLNLNDSNEISNIKVIYHEKIEEIGKYEGNIVSVSSDDKYAPYEEPFLIKFKLKEELFGMFDESINYKLKNIKLNLIDLKEKEYDDFCEHFSCEGSKINGFAYFTQSDPGYFVKDRVLLLQLDSEFGMMWGDMGVANWFISKKDLLDRNFDNVMFNWDCH